QTTGEWIWSIVDTCLAAPGLALSAIVAVVLLVTGIVTLTMDAPSSLESVAWFVIVAAVIKLLFLGFLFRMTWRRGIAETAAQKVSSKATSVNKINKRGQSIKGQ